MNEEDEKSWSLSTSSLDSTSVTTPTLTSSTMPSDAEAVSQWQDRQEVFASRQQARRDQRRNTRIKRSAKIARTGLTGLNLTNSSSTTRQKKGPSPDDSSQLLARQPTTGTTPMRRNKRKRKGVSNETVLAMVMLFMMLSFGGLGVKMMFDKLGAGTSSRGGKGGMLSVFFNNALNLW